jgi:hypothetical protein
MPAGAHDVSGFSVSCSTVTATVADTNTPDLNDHPMVWNVRIDGGAFQLVTSTETNVGGPGEDVVTLTADISSFTSNLEGGSATVEAFVSFPSGTLPAMTGTVTCGTTPTTPTTTPTTINQGAQVSPEIATRPSTPSAVAPTAAAPTAVAVAPRVTG